MLADAEETEQVELCPSSEAWELETRSVVVGAGELAGAAVGIATEDHKLWVSETSGIVTVINKVAV